MLRHTKYKYIRNIGYTCHNPASKSTTNAETAGSPSSKRTILERTFNRNKEINVILCMSIGYEFRDVARNFILGGPANELKTGEVYKY